MVPQQLEGSSNDLGSSQPTGQTSPDILLIVFIHGYCVTSIYMRGRCSNTYTPSSFKGDDTTFGDFPSRLQHILSESTQGIVIESIVFPAYEVRLVLSVFPYIHRDSMSHRPGVISYVLCSTLTLGHNNSRYRTKPLSALLTG
jgi:hypothetical protein